MPKRQYPFEDDYLPQLKTHVGQKQVNQGVSQAERMKNVYNRTLSLLRDGAKEMSRNKANDSLTNGNFILEDSNSNSILQDSNECIKKSVRRGKQMILSKDLRLEVAQNEDLQKDLPISLCRCCRTINQKIAEKCYYCDELLCSFCLGACYRCNEVFCQNCSQSMYDDEERNVCHSCYE